MSMDASVEGDGNGRGRGRLDSFSYLLAACVLTYYLMNNRIFSPYSTGRKGVRIMELIPNRFHNLLTSPLPGGVTTFYRLL